MDSLVMVGSQNKRAILNFKPYIALVRRLLKMQLMSTLYRCGISKPQVGSVGTEEMRMNPRRWACLERSSHEYAKSQWILQCIFKSKHLIRWLFAWRKVLCHGSECCFCYYKKGPVMKTALNKYKNYYIMINFELKL